MIFKYFNYFLHRSLFNFRNGITNGIIIPSPEDDQREEDNEATLYGSVYSDLLDNVEDVLIDILNRAKAGQGVVEYEYSGTW